MPLHTFFRDFKAETAKRIRHPRALLPLPWPVCCIALGVFSTACTPQVPERYVIEKDVATFQYRRYQQVLQVELPVEGNPAIAHTATYVRGGETILIAPVVLTTYEHASGLAESLRQRLRSMEDYTFEVRKLSGSYVWHLQGADDVWVLWVSGPYLVKLGAPEGQSQVPEPLLEAYLKQYPSALDARGKAKDEAASNAPASATPPAKN